MAVFLTGRMLQALSYDIIQKCHENCKFSFSMLQLSVTFLGVGIEGCRGWGVLVFLHPCLRCGSLIQHVEVIHYIGKYTHQIFLWSLQFNGTFFFSHFFHFGITSTFWKNTNKPSVEKPRAISPFIESGLPPRISLTPARIVNPRADFSSLRSACPAHFFPT